MGFNKIMALGVPTASLRISTERPRISFSENSEIYLLNPNTLELSSPKSVKTDFTPDDPNWKDRDIPINDRLNDPNHFTNPETETTNWNLHQIEIRIFSNLIQLYLSDSSDTLFLFIQRNLPKKWPDKNTFKEALRDASTEKKMLSLIRGHTFTIDDTPQLMDDLDSDGTPNHDSYRNPPPLE